MAGTRNPTKVVFFSTDHFLCEADAKCLPAAALCNGVAECSDGHDELNCTHRVNQHVCEVNEFECGDGECATPANLKKSNQKSLTRRQTRWGTKRTS